MNEHFIFLRDLFSAEKCWYFMNIIFSIDIYYFIVFFHSALSFDIYWTVVHFFKSWLPVNIKYFTIIIWFEFKNPLFVEHLMRRNQLIFMEKGNLMRNLSSVNIFFIGMIANFWF